ncbi:hypothetical protein F4803DRAFT_577454 [Xylaria telfairii]|nr:hypothetical protein F4803DRAFT_577454 [Xylaria telfairii]
MSRLLPTPPQESSSRAVLEPWSTASYSVNMVVKYVLLADSSLPHLINRVFHSFIFILDYHLCPSSRSDIGKLPSTKNQWKSMFPKANFYDFKYETLSPTTVKDLLNPQYLDGHVDDLLRLIKDIPRDNNAPSRVILVGYGYGGLISEQATRKIKEETTQLEIIGVVLFGTPHFRVGLTQWAIICAWKPHNREANKNIAASRKEVTWHDCEENIELLIKKQLEFRNICTRPHASTKVLCCFADVVERRGESNRSLPAQWCILADFGAAHIRSTYIELTTFAKDVDYEDVGRIVDRWIPEDGNWGGNGDEAVAKLRQRFRAMLERSDSTQSDNEPGGYWVYPEGNLDHIKVGTVISEKDQTVDVIALAGELDANGSQKASNKTIEPHRAADPPTTRDPTPDDQSFEIEQLTRDSVFSYARVAVKREAVRKRLVSGSEAVYLVVGTKTEYRPAKGTSNAAITIVGEPGAANDPKGKETLTSLEAESHIKGLKLRRLRLTLRSRGSNKDKENQTGLRSIK